MQPKSLSLTLILLLLLGACDTRDLVEISGELRQWHAVTLTVEGPFTNERDGTNPFTDYRLDVAFTGSSDSTVVPGYYAADGNAGESGAEGGNKWKVHFTPKETGTWRFEIMFRNGEGIAVSEDPENGTPAGLHGVSGSFEILPTDKTGRDHRSKGTLRYVGERYLQFAATKEWFLKGGTDSPENFLAYVDFDGTWDRAEGGERVNDDEPVAQGFLHSYGPHIEDWRPGDPSWKDGKGKGMIGALNYLAGKGMNSVYFLTMNVAGDGDDVWPWIDPEERYRFDCSKLDQWNTVFTHMTKLGLMMHVITQETENDQLLDGGELGPERKLYYRELIARFSHHPAIVWNLGEENTNTTEQLKAFARAIHDIDPYDHPVVVHTHPDKKQEVYSPLLGFEYMEGASLQNLPDENHEAVKEWIDRSKTAGRTWAVFQDEQGPHQTGVVPDDDDPEHDMIRDRFLWGSLLAGAAGVEWYMGYEHSHNDLDCEDWRSRDRMWDLTRIALGFMKKNLPFAEMRHADALTSSPSDYVFAKPGEVYAVYLPQGDIVKIDLEEHEGTFAVRWFNPRSGGGLETGTVSEIAGPGMKSLGRPPLDHGQDWVVLVQKK
jgi:hypothetical protein